VPAPPDLSLIKSAESQFSQTCVKIHQKIAKIHGNIAGFVIYLRNVFVYYFKEPW
jgi:hypothetical protein